MDLEWLQDRRTCLHSACVSKGVAGKASLYVFSHWMKLLQTAAPLGCGLSAPPGCLQQLRPHLGSKEKQKGEIHCHISHKQSQGKK